MNVRATQIVAIALGLGLAGCETIVPLSWESQKAPSSAGQTGGGNLVHQVGEAGRLTVVGGLDSDRLQAPMNTAADDTRQQEKPKVTGVEKPRTEIPATDNSDAKKPSQVAPAPQKDATAKAETVGGRALPAYAQLETFPIDLPTVIRLVDENSPAIGFTQARVREAQARLELAELQWIPNLSLGMAYNRFDGQTQNQAGFVFGRSRANLFAGAVPSLTLDLADAYFRPLVERRVTAAEQLRSTATTLASELEAVSAYLDLLQVHAQVAINGDTLQKANEMLKAAQNAKDAKLDRTAGDVNRAQIEVLVRRTERIELEGRIGSASARLGRLLLLPPSLKLVPADPAVTPITLIDPSLTLDNLVTLAVNNRPDLAANRELIAAAWERVRKEERGPFIPKIALTDQTGAFGGGINSNLQDFSYRNALGAQLYWEVKNLGFGNHTNAAERRAALDQAQLQLVEAQARVAAEIVDAAQLAASKLESLDLSERSVKEATELYRISREGTLNVIDAKNLFDALRPLQSIQVLNQARQGYLSAVIEFNRAQYRLYTAIGNSPATAH